MENETARDDLCPLCLTTNQCAVIKNKKPETCWCMKMAISAEVLKRASSNQESCICPKCASSEI
ncbi:cysteine-rich CWC family protein [Fictibacillus iocasae]|uniref:Cysteine-rich CWC family protein n=1 Tax=Fictibacillus iocasae TaxID=2715437 RepID=A0ABW2NJB5_9BACL